MLLLKRTNSQDPHFVQLVALLNADLRIRDGEEYGFYSQFNHIDQIKYVVVGYWQEEPVGCGAIKRYDETTMEVKRMFVQPAFRGKGIAAGILTELERWTAELQYTKCILETGKRQPEAIALYRKQGYQSIPRYGQYQNVESSVCFIKELPLSLS